MFVERRLHVRIRPTLELPAYAVVASDGLVHERIEIIDIAVGGMKLAIADIPKDATLRLSLGPHGDHDVQVDVRWRSPSAVGIQFVAPSEAAFRAINRYVSELLERGR
jgi:hypothetical protein